MSRAYNTIHGSINCQRAINDRRKGKSGTTDILSSPKGATRNSRKEVIQPQVPLRLPCYDFAPVTELTLDGCITSFQFPGLAPSRVIRLTTDRVAPFGNPRINACVQLP